MVTARADGEVAPGRHHARCVAGAELGGVLGEGRVSHVMESFDLPVAADQGRELGRSGLVGGEVGDRVDGFHRGLPGLGVGAAAFELQGLGGVWKEQAVHRDDLEPADLAASVSGVAGAVLERDLGPGQRAQLRVELLLVALHDHDVVGSAAADQAFGVLALGVQGVGGDDRPRSDRCRPTAVGTGPLRFASHRHQAGPEPLRRHLRRRPAGGTGGRAAWLHHAPPPRPAARCPPDGGCSLGGSSGRVSVVGHKLAG